MPGETDSEMRYASPNVLQVYLAGPITGHEDTWREKLQSELRYKYGIVAVLPQASELYAEELDIARPAPVLTVRDRWMCTKSDVVLVNFTGSVKASIGTCIEIGWASEAGVPIISVVPIGNIHNHDMIESLSTFLVQTIEEATTILRGLQGWV